MFARIVVALDGSELAERVLPYVVELAGRFGSAVTLLRATTPVGTLISATGPGALPPVGPVVDPQPIVEPSSVRRPGTSTHSRTICAARAWWRATSSMQGQPPTSSSRERVTSARI